MDDLHDHAVSLYIYVGEGFDEFSEFFKEYFPDS